MARTGNSFGMAPKAKDVWEWTDISRHMKDFYVNSKPLRVVRNSRAITYNPLHQLGRGIEHFNVIVTSYTVYNGGWYLK